MLCELCGFFARNFFSLLFRCALILFLNIQYQLSGIQLSAQPSYFPLNRDVHSTYESFLNNKEYDLHSSIKPYLIPEVNNYIDVDSVNNAYDQNSFLRRRSGKNYSVKIGNKRSQIDVSLLFSLQPGIDLMNTDRVLETSAGAIIRGHFGEKVSFSAKYSAGNSGFVEYLDSIINNNDIVPGQGYAHETNLGYAYGMFSGYLSYSPSKHFNFQIGQDKNFWGDGYRSLLLSDNSYSYPFFKISTNVWKLKYVNLYTAFRDIRNLTPNSSFPVIAGDGWGRIKYGTFHYLSWNITKWLNIGLFEAIIWQGEDSSGVRGYDINYLNPVIFYRPVEFSLGSPDNALLGMSLKLKIAKKQQLYAQIILDEFLLKEVKAGNGWWANKQGFQVGFKIFDLFKIDNLSGQAEINYVRPYTYSHGTSLQNYAHFNQPLAHPLGANFYETVSFLRYGYKNWLFEGKLLYAVYGADSSGSNWGGNIFLDYKTREQDYNNTVTQGLKTTLIYGDLRISYLIVSGLNLRIEAGISNRIQHSILNTGQTNFIYIGLRTALSNVYYDM